MSRATDPTPAELAAMFIYDPETGFVTRRVRLNRRHAGERAGFQKKDGYRYIVIDQKYHVEHRICWALYYGAWPEVHLDHRDMNRSDNRIANLRLATDAQNACNRHVQKNNTTGFKGVQRLKSGRYHAQITAGGRTYRLGQFDTAPEAGAAYAAASEKYHGEYGRA